MRNLPPEKVPGLRVFNVFVNNEYYEVEETGGVPAVTRITRPARPTAPAALPPKSEEKKTKEAPVAKPITLTEGEIAIRTPMPGMVIDDKEGDNIKSGDVVIVLEAMKMENSLTSPADGVIKKINLHTGSSGSKDDVLCIISTQS